MNSFIHFFDTFFSLWLYNHSHLSIVCLSIFFSMLMLSINLQTMELAVVKKIKSFDTYMMMTYLWIIVTIVSGFILTYKELSFFKSLINVLFPLLIFLLITRKIIFFIFPFSTFTVYAKEQDFYKLKRIYVVIMILFILFSTKLGMVLKHIL